MEQEDSEEIAQEWLAEKAEPDKICLCKRLQTGWQQQKGRDTDEGGMCTDLR